MTARCSTLLAAVAICAGVVTAPQAEARIRLSSPEQKQNRRGVLQRIEGSELYKTESGEKDTTHTRYRQYQRDARNKQILDELKRRGYIYKGEELDTSIESGGDEPRAKRTKPGTAYTPLEPLRIPEAATTRLLRIRGLLRETTIADEECRGLSGSRLARCRYEQQQKKGEGAPQMIEEEPAP